MKDNVIDFETIDDRGPQSYRATFDINASDLGCEEVVGLGTIGIETNVQAGHLPGEYDADGTVTFTADLSCSRCAEPYPFANPSAFHVRFRPRPEASADEEVEITEEGELDVEFYSEPVIPLRDLALEQVQLSIPMKPLCDENCLGLCPTCGVNRTREKCSCDAPVVDERWGSLKELREQLEKKMNG